MGRLRSENLRQLRAHFRAWGKPLRTIASLSIVSAVLDAAVLVAIAPLVTSVAAKSQVVSGSLAGVHLEISFANLLLLTGLVILVRAAVSLAAKTIEARLLARYEASMRSECLRAFTAATWELQSRERSGHLQQYLGGHIGRSQTALRSVSIGLSELCGLVILVVGAVVIGGPAVLLGLAALAVIGASLRPFQRISREASREQSELGPHWTSQIAETTSMARETRLLGVADVVLDRTRATIDRMRLLREREQVFTNGAPVLYETTALLLLTGGLWAIRVVQPENLTAIGASALLLLRALLRGRNLQNQYQTVNNLMPFVSDLDHQLRLYENEADADGDRDLDRVESISLNDLSFTYADGEEVLRDISFTITAGESLGIIGPSGVGKSTLLELLLRLRRPTRGSVELNGLDLASFTRRTLYQRIRLVPQDPLLFDASVRDNVAGFAPRSDEEVWAALGLVGLADEVLGMGGLDAQVGQFGGRLSGGQRQRLAIARAMIEDPDVLILDEPTGALDAHSESVVQQSLRALANNVTLIVVAHRLSTLEICGTIVVLGDGTIRAIGPREQLQATDAYYREALQLSGLR